MPTWRIQNSQVEEILIKRITSEMPTEKELLECYGQNAFVILTSLLATTDYLSAQYGLGRDFCLFNRLSPVVVKPRRVEIECFYVGYRLDYATNYL